MNNPRVTIRDDGNDNYMILGWNYQCAGTMLNNLRRLYKLFDNPVIIICGKLSTIKELRSLIRRTFS